MDAVLQEAARRDLAHEPYILVTVVRTLPPTSAAVGARALVSADRKLTGFVGGECTRRILLEVAEEAFMDGRPRLLLLSPDPEHVEPSSAPSGIVVKPMTCHSGGTVELFVEPRLVDPALLVVGESPVAKNLVDLAQNLPFTLYHETLSGEKDWDALATQIKRHATVGGFVVVATMGQYDDWAVDTLSGADIRYLGVVASPRRGALLRERFSHDRPTGDSCVVSIPAGLNLGSRLPGEIAISILAEIIQIRRTLGVVNAGHGQRHLEDKMVTDPICHMQVNLADTPYRTLYGGKEWGFCARSCLDAFLREPERYSEI